MGFLPKNPRAPTHISRTGRAAENEPVAGGQVIAHVDMDAFFASVSLRDRPDLQGFPVVIGGGDRGVVLAANYPARKYGLHSALPMSAVRRQCAHAVILPPEREKYVQVSRAIMALCESLTPFVEPLSIDEAFMDLTGMNHFPSAQQGAQWLRAEVQKQHGVTCSVGIGPAMFIAKMATTYCKPDGLLEVSSGEVLDFLHPQKVESLWGIGPSSADLLHSLGIKRIGQLAHTPVSTLERTLGVAQARQVYELAWGRDQRRVQAVDVHEAAKSISADMTFPEDIDSPQRISTYLLRVSDKVGMRTRAAAMVGNTITITIKFSDFTRITRSLTLADPTDSTHVINRNAQKLFQKLNLQRARVRMVGVRVSNLRYADEVPWQGQLWDDDARWRDVDRGLDEVRRKFGAHAVQAGSLLDDDFSRRN